MANHNFQPDKNGKTGRDAPTRKTESAPDELVPQKDNPAEPEHNIAEHPEDQNTG